MSRAATLMIQGTASSVGKSLIVAGLCRFYAREGLRVAPFKAQNMALNSFVTAEGGEMGRAQVVQAEAARIAPSVDMNPILLKPEAASRSQVIVRGRVQGTIAAADFFRRKLELWPVVADSLDRLRETVDLVVIEGAGSPAEINLKAGDIVNMRVARHAGSPVLIVGDIDRGGVFAALLGTMQLLDPGEAALVRGFVINKFRGDAALLAPGLRLIEERTGVPVWGVVPYLPDLGIAEEDSVALDDRRETVPGTALDVAVIRLPYTQNFDDFDPLDREPGIHLRYVRTIADLGDPHLIILPGTKLTVHDLDFLRGSGLAARVIAHVRSGRPVIGVCGGYQMLGEWIEDPDGVEAARPRVPGLGLLPVSTRFQPSKHTRQVSGRILPHPGLLAGMAGLPATGYEIHTGESAGRSPAIEVPDPTGRTPRPDGSVDGAGLVVGTYFHGLFHVDAVRRALLTNVARLAGHPWRPTETETTDPYNRLADCLAEALGRDRLLALVPGHVAS